MTTARWLDFLEQEYLSDFIPAGGAAVKFAVPVDDAAAGGVLRDLRVRGAAAGLLVLDVNAAATRVHMVDQVFHRLADQVPWHELSRTTLERFARESAYVVPAERSGAFLDALAKANDMDSGFLLQEARRWIQNNVFKDTALSKDFRIAMTQLTLAELTGGPEGETIFDVITDWITGRNKAISAVKPYGIRTRIMRTNARHFLESLAHWVRRCERPGIVLLVNLERLTVPKNPHDSQLFYTRAALLDAYEVLRQFIDTTDRLESCLLVLVAAPEFLDTEKQTRGMGSYEALMFRIYDEIRDRELANPMASLVRLEGVR